MPVLSGAEDQPGYVDPINQRAPQQDRTQELQLFMMSIRNQHSGSYAGSYSSEGGAYGITVSAWDAMARRAGLDGADMRDTAMQDYVAAWTMKAYFAKYQNWALVALAWQKGTRAADNVVKSLDRDPQYVQSWEIDNYYDDTSVHAVMSDMGKLGYRGITGEADLNPTLEQGVNRPTQVITGTGRVSVEDTYNATVRALRDEFAAEGKANAPSASEVLFQQIDEWSNSVAGGARQDYRTDVSQVQADRSQVQTDSKGQQLESMKIERQK